MHREILREVPSLNLLVMAQRRYLKQQFLHLSRSFLPRSNLERLLEPEVVRVNAEQGDVVSVLFELHQSFASLPVAKDECLLLKVFQRCWLPRPLSVHLGVAACAALEAGQRAFLGG